MKLIWLTLIIGLLSSMSLKAENVLSRDALQLMAALNVKEFSDIELKDRRNGVLSELRFTKFGILDVRHEKYTSTSSAAYSTRLTLLGQDGRERAFVIVEFTKSARAAQSVLFERLAMSSMPVQMLAQQLEVQNDGPGDISILFKKYDHVGGHLVINESSMVFIRDNVLVSISSHDPGIKAIALAKELDHILVEDDK